MGSILIVDSNSNDRDTLFATIREKGESPMSCSSCSEALALLSTHRFKAVFCTDNLPDGEYVEVISAAKSVPVIIIFRSAECDAHLAALRAGAFDYITWAPAAAELDRILTSALESSPPTKESVA